MTARPAPTPGPSSAAAEGYIPAGAHAQPGVCPALRAVGLRPADPSNPSALVDPVSASRHALVPPIDRAPEPQQVRAFRYGLAAAGVGCVGFAAVGVVVPGMPTTIFLIMATWCFARSCPWLTDRLIRNRFFGPFLKYLEPGVTMPRRAKAVAMLLMWTAIAVSCGLLVARGVSLWIPAIIVAAGVVGSICIARQGLRAG